MLTKDFYFNLPEELIAQKPSDKRGQEKLLLLDRKSGSFKDYMMKDFLSLVDKNSVLVVNNSKVRKARVYGESEKNEVFEFLFLHREGERTWSCMTRKARKQKIGESIKFTSKDKSEEKYAEILKVEDGIVSLIFREEIGESFFDLYGSMPLPPYIKRKSDKEDDERYQTVYAKHIGSVASPTAGLHFTNEILEEIKKTFPLYEVTLHVGAGTFLPVRTERVENHKMHSEEYSIDEKTAEALNEAKREGKIILAIGTTTLRTLESSAYSDGIVKSGKGESSLFIYPPYRFRFVDSLLTNFHTPSSTLLMLVSALAGKDLIFSSYEHAIKEKYRFFSYGDAMFIK